jgi:hypothetical protein
VCFSLWQNCLFVCCGLSRHSNMPGGIKLYQVVGRKAPTTADPNPAAYRMKLFAPNEVMAKSRFWYFMHQMRKMKKTTGEILDVNEVSYGFSCCESVC